MEEERLEDLIEHLEQAAHHGEGRSFTKEEVLLLKKWIEILKLIISWGRLGKLLLWLLMTVSAALVAWGHVKDHLVELFK